MYERVALVALQRPDVNNELFQMKLQEFKDLVNTAGGEVAYLTIQKRSKPNARTYIGQGKLEEIAKVSEEQDIDLVIFYDSLSPSQLRNIENTLKMPVIDRVQLILDIFTLRAKSREAQLQVSLAQKTYLLPRLNGQGLVLSRLGGGIGTRGPGETQLERDRRKLRKEITHIKKELTAVAKQRQINREQRLTNDIFKIGLVGYTNAGKSTILNALTGAETYEKDELFATLSPLTRRLVYANHFEVLLTDTVGFIQDLPPQVVEAFHSTLEESRYMDLLLLVIDSANYNSQREQQVVMQLLETLDLIHIPHVFVYNKADIATDNSNRLWKRPYINISALDEVDISKLKDCILEQVRQQYQAYKVKVAKEYYGQWLSAANAILIEQVEFDENAQNYIISCYKPAHLCFPSAIIAYMSIMS